MPDPQSGVSCQIAEPGSLCVSGELWVDVGDEMEEQSIGAITGDQLTGKSATNFGECSQGSWPRLGILSGAEEE